MKLLTQEIIVPAFVRAMGAPFFHHATIDKLRVVRSDDLNRDMLHGTVVIDNEKFHVHLDTGGRWHFNFGVHIPGRWDTS